MNKPHYLALAASLLAAGAYAASPVVQLAPDGIVLSAISNNGKYALSANSTENSEGISYSAGGKIWDTATMKSTNVSLTSGLSASINDITDDGNVVVGAYMGAPAYYLTATKEWVTLPMPQGFMGGNLVAVTPDGSRAVGYLNRNSDWDGTPVAYDLTGNSILTLEGIPTVNMNGDEADFSAFCGISADGRYILGRLSQDVLMPVSMCAYIYDTQTHSVNYIGFTPGSKKWTPAYSDCLFIDNATMSPEGNYVTGGAYIAKDQDAQFGEEYYVAYRYNVATKQIEVFDGAYDSDILGFSITNSGITLASTPAVNPYSSMVVRSGKYYYPLDEIFKQAYGVDFYSKTGRANTGKPVAVSADGKTLCMISGPTESYLLRMPDDWADACAKVNLLNTFSVNPPAGSVFSELSQITLAFSRGVEMAGSAPRIKIIDSEGNELRTANKAEAKDNTVTISFRPYALKTGKTYTVVIPAGQISMLGDMTVASNEIRIDYVGRTSGPIALVNALPEDGSAMSRLDASTNPIYLQFNASVKIANGAKGQLYRKGESSPFCALELSLYSGNVLSLYPLSRQNLYDGTEYEVVLPAASITDLGGAGANEEIRLNYKGTYVREISADDKYLFSDECMNYDGFMFFDGDQLAPAATPASWGFTAAVPWYIVRSSTETTNMALAAHSMFSGSGKADDWMVTPQIYIPDAQCYLTFEAQSYKASKADRLKVILLQTENVYSSLTPAIVNEFRTNGVTIFDEQLTPGQSEEGLEDDWTTYNVLLPDYAGKNVYLAFVNDNENQSAVFINRVEVIHDMKFLTSITSPATVVARTEATISGSVTIASDLLTASTIFLTLSDAQGAKISEISATDLNLSKGQAYSFTFPQPLPLQTAVANKYVVDVLINGSERSSAAGSVKNLAFQPTRRVIVEEYSGMNCPNCPKGFQAMENLERIFPGQIIPIILRTYENDPLGTGLGDYTNFIGLGNVGAPSGLINRNYVGFPMYSDAAGYYFSHQDAAAEMGLPCWLDLVVEEMKDFAECDVEAEGIYDGHTGQVTLEGSAKWAMNVPATNVNVFVVILEDNVPTYQQNNLYSTSDPLLGPWGKDGIYGKSAVAINLNDVARGAFGRTFNGTPGLIPSTLEAEKAYPFSLAVTMPETVSVAENTKAAVVLINGDTDRVINAAIAPINVINAIEEVEADCSNAPVEYFNIQGRRVTSPAHGQLLIKRQGKKVTKIIF